MKSSKLLLLLGLLFCGSLFGQVKIGDNPQAIDPGSVLELESSERVLVITRVSTAEMNAITPLQGALVYNTDLQCVHYFNGTAWVNLCGEGGATANITADPIIHDIATIALTPSPNGTNIEIAENSISSEMIVNGGVNGVDIQNGSIGPGKLQNQSVTVDKLSQNAVGPFAINRDSLPVSFFENDIGYLTEINILSDAPENVLSLNNGGVFYDDTDLLNAVNGAEINLNNHIGDDNDIDAQNELSNLVLNGNILTLSNPLTAGNQVTLPTGGGENPNNELITDADLLGTDLVITEAGTAWSVSLAPLAGGGSGSTEEVDGITLTGVGTNADPFKIEPSAVNGQFLSTTAGAVTWANLPGGTGGTVESDGVTIEGNGVSPNPLQIRDGGVTPPKIEPSATDGQVLTTVAGNVAWATATAGASITGTTIDGDGTVATPLELADDAVTTIKILDANVTPPKIEPSATDGQVLTTVAGNVAWATATAGASVTGTTIDGDGTLATPLELADDAVTTVKILDANVTPPKIEPSATDGQVLTTVAGNVAWATATAGASVTGTTIDGDGTVATPLELADDAVTTIKILDANVTPPKIEPSSTDGQVLTTVAGNVAWATTAAGASATGTTIDGDGTLATPLELADDAVTSVKILNATVAAEDLNDMGAANGEVLKWNGANWAPAVDTGGSQNLFESDFTLAANRTHNLGGNNFVLGGSGNVAIGTLPGAPQDRLDVDGQIRARNGFASTEGSAGNPGYGFYTGGNTDMGMFRAGVNNLGFSTAGTEVIRIDENQNVGIGIPAPTEKLHVIGNILASGTITPDYVFQTYFDGKSSLNPEYKMFNLQQIEDFVRSHKHLPGVPSAKDIKEKGGILINKSTEINLEKIEELFLHTIEQEKKINQLKTENQAISKELATLKKELEKLKNLIENR
ncbi:bZIP transcription factor [Maribacter halichondriae]|uniref:bZIP transcription factor n=1 Tax=Maribacter halichondriae TaxID=2980554 RepID=UPI002359ED40|nr:bZIP transcription factor [Maribacter sp. Hal144]